MSLLEKYTSATELTRRMLEAARVQNWEELAAAGAARDNILEDLPQNLPPMSVQDSREMARLIEEILGFHAIITNHCAPWLEHTARLLAAFDQANSTTLPMQASNPETK